MPCTQYGAHPEFQGRYDQVFEAGDFPNWRRLNLRKGTGWEQDPRAFHRGTPNRSDHPRPELVICYSLPWFAEHGVTMTRAEYSSALRSRARAAHPVRGPGLTRLGFGGCGPLAAFVRPARPLDWIELRLYLRMGFRRRFLLRYHEAPLHTAAGRPLSGHVRPPWTKT